MSGFRNFVLVAVLAVGVVGGLASEGKAQTAQQYLAQAASYEQTAAQLEERARSSSAALAAQMRAQAAQLRQAAQRYRQLAGQVARPPAQAQPQPKPPAFNAAQIALQANQAWLNRVRTMRPGRNGGFLIYYSNPPIYQGQTTFTPNARPWFVRSNDMFRVLQMLTNNRQRVDNIVPN